MVITLVKLFSNTELHQYHVIEVNYNGKFFATLAPGGENETFTIKFKLWQFLMLVFVIAKSLAASTCFFFRKFWRFHFWNFIQMHLDWF
jgi:hypothetical protein